MMQHLVSSLSVSGRPVHRLRENCFAAHVELIGIINKLLLLHLVGCPYYLFTWDLWRTKCRWDSFFSEHFAFLLVINIPANLISHALSELGKLCQFKPAVSHDSDYHKPVTTVQLSVSSFHFRTHHHHHHHYQNR